MELSLKAKIIVLFLFIILIPLQAYGVQMSQKIYASIASQENYAQFLWTDYLKSYP